MMMMKLVVVSSLLYVVSLYAQHSMNNENSSMSGEMFVHPFFAHMGIPDQPGEVSLRTLLMQTNSRGDLTTDFGLHIETGIVDRIGIHLRNNALREEDNSEIMLQGLLLVDNMYRNGFAISGELEVPTGSHKSTHYDGTAGISGMFTIASITNYNGTIEYAFGEKNVEYEGSFVFKTSKVLFPVIEYNGDISSDFLSLYLLPGIKFKINSLSAFGAGVQIAVSHDREFDIRALATYEFAIGM